MQKIAFGLAFAAAASLSMLTLAGTASAQEKPAEPVAKAEPSDGTQDGARLRIGFGFHGGVGFGDRFSGPVIGASLRLGVQVNHYFAAYYQQTPMVTILANDAGSSAAAGFVDFNSGVANLTLGHMLDIGAGPSADYVSVASCSATELACAAGSTFAFGVQSRVALNLGGLKDGVGPRRRAFSLGVDFHPVFLSAGPISFLTASLGGEWY
jgi:hypothetical protein